MYLHKIYLNLRCKEARRDMADSYEMHSTLCRAFADSEIKCPPGTFLWRLEPESCLDGKPVLIVQSRILPEWSRINPREWFLENPTNPIDIEQKLSLKDVKTGNRFRYRLRANPSVRRNGKRIGLFGADAQIQWLERQGVKNGFKPLTIHRSEEKMLTGLKRSEHSIRVFSVLYDGILEVADIELFGKAVREGIGHAKAIGLGLLSVIPVE
jgi:CRISPR system Cascade subunit CasE